MQDMVTAPLVDTQRSQQEMPSHAFHPESMPALIQRRIEQFNRCLQPLGQFAHASRRQRLLKE